MEMVGMGLSEVWKCPASDWYPEKKRSLLCDAWLGLMKLCEQRVVGGRSHLRLLVFSRWD